jgi:protein SCO1/2
MSRSILACGASSKVTLIAIITALNFCLTTYAHEIEENHSASSKISRSTTQVSLPNLKVIKKDGTEVNLQSELNSNQIQVVSFVYSTCKTLCPMTNQILQKTQERLGSDLKWVHISSFSIDPEYDTPEKMRLYTKMFHTKDAWQHYSMYSESDSIAIQRAFDVYKGDKMNHIPVFFIKQPKSTNWTRIDGLISGEDLTNDIRKLIKSN